MGNETWQIPSGLPHAYLGYSTRRNKEGGRERERERKREREKEREREERRRKRRRERRENLELELDNKRDSLISLCVLFP